MNQENEQTKQTDYTSDFIKHMDSYGSSPAMLQRDVLEAIKKMSDGEYSIVSADNPVALVLESSAVQTAGFIGQNHILNRRQYPVAAQTMEDLYYHLSDLDWVGVFALPNKARISVSFEYDELVSMLKPNPEGTGNLLRIPKGASFNVGDVDFTLEYPIDILQLKHGGFSVRYNTDEKSPIHTLTTNIVEHFIAVNSGIKRFTINFEVIQATVAVFEDSITSNSPINLDKAFNDQYFFARVFVGNDESGWKELKTTHRPDIFDPSEPTAVLKLKDDILNINVPKIYNTDFTDPKTGLVTYRLGSRIRVELYSTLGEMQMNLDKYSASQFKYNWFPAGARKRDYSGLGDYSSELQGIRSTVVFSDDFLSGGRDELTFEELRKRVIKHTIGPNEVPISNASIESKIQDAGFNIVKAIDYVTKREYWATRSMPLPTATKLITPASASIETINTTVAELVATGTVKDNGKRITILSNSLFHSLNGITKILSKKEIDRVLSLAPEPRSKEVNKKELFYNPFHYVIDMNNDEMSVRPYYFDNPRAMFKSYLDSNVRLPITLTIDSYKVDRIETGYKITVITRSGDTYKSMADNNLFAQLLVHPSGEKGYAYVIGNLVGRTDKREPIFEFLIETNFDVDTRDNLITTNMALYNTGATNVPIPLETEFEILFGFYGPMDEWSAIPLDNKIARHIARIDDAKAILCESLRIRLGYHLKYLWTRARTNASDVTYRRYPENVPLLYSEDVYLPVAENNSIISVRDNAVHYNLVHRKGDPVMDNEGLPVYRHLKGDLVKDDNGRPIVTEPRKIIRRIELMLVDAAYWFATDEVAKAYRGELVETFLDWLVNDLEPINERALEQTRLKFYPSATMGLIKVMYNDGLTTFISASQSLTIDMTVPKQIYSNAAVLDKIKESTIRIVNDELSKQSVSASTISARLVKEYGNDVTGIKIRGFGGNDRIVTFTVLEENKRCTIRKKLLVQADNTLGVVEDVTFNIFSHSIGDAE